MRHLQTKNRKELSILKVELAELLQKIEQLRHHLHELVKDRSFTDPLVLQASHRLDEVLNQYERLNRQA